VIVEADGEWHTADNNYASAAWKAAHLPSVPERHQSPQKTLPVLKNLMDSPGRPTTDQNGNEIVVLDSDDEDEGRVKRELSPSFGRDSSSSANRSNEMSLLQLQLQSQSQRGDDVIDLTLDSDDDQPPVPRRLEKRKATDGGMSPTEQIWKKGRQENESPSAMPVTNGRVNGTSSVISLDPNTYGHYSSHRSQSSQSASHSSIASPPTQYATQFPGAGIQTAYPYSRPLQPRTISTAGSPQLPRNPYIGRINARWPGT